MPATVTAAAYLQVRPARPPGGVLHAHGEQQVGTHGALARGGMGPLRHFTRLAHKEPLPRRLRIAGHILPGAQHARKAWRLREHHRRLAARQAQRLRGGVEWGLGARAAGHAVCWRHCFLSRPAQRWHSPHPDQVSVHRPPKPLPCCPCCTYSPAARAAQVRTHPFLLSMLPRPTLTGSLWCSRGKGSMTPLPSIVRSSRKSVSARSGTSASSRTIVSCGCGAVSGRVRRAGGHARGNKLRWRAD